ncbi:VOC family protein [Sphingomonas bacterium]|uniref:VOC family protein n=1 Tax=Sphingomonas bacterium TaxID=1895847 RepID=UPI002612C2F1|nr:VOC family protein [Sphingomonas bacterium]MDB5678486.1 lactoylglutathione lyase family protein [Sphingomonas bacterium]
MLANHIPGLFIATDDPDRARAFYADTLGLPYLGFDGFAHSFRAGPNTLRIVKPPQRVQADYTVLGWVTPDIVGDVAALTAKGVAFERYAFFGEQQDASGIWSAPGGHRVAWFKDPDGNVLSLAQHAAS